MAKIYTTEKPCTRCKATKPLSEFFMQGGYPAGMCKPCFRSYQAERRRILGQADRSISAKEGGFL